MSDVRWQSVPAVPPPMRLPLPMPVFAHRAPRIDLRTLRVVSAQQSVSSTHAVDDAVDIVALAKPVSTAADIDTLLASEGMARLWTFLLALNAQATNRRAGETADEQERLLQPSPSDTEDDGRVEGGNTDILADKLDAKAVQRVVDALATLHRLIDAMPPRDDSTQRFGSKDFRLWFAEMERQAPVTIAALLPAGHHPVLAAELCAYWTGAFGNMTRIDYGTGHELSFLAFMCCLHLVGYWRPSARLALIVFHSYLHLVRHLQVVYRLEPAGSHGVWGLDDFQFLPYVLGAAQLHDHRHLRPKSFADREIVDAYAGDYLFLEAIQFVHRMKTGPFHEHSPVLYDISGVPTWNKVNSGLLKMYVAEVLKKVPIMQHLPFGTLLPWRAANGSQHVVE